MSGSDDSTVGITYLKGEGAEGIYLKHCKLCHGRDGQRMLGGAKDLSVSMMSLEERMTIISEGKGKMASYTSKLSLEEIEALAMYIETLRQ